MSKGETKQHKLWPHPIYTGVRTVEVSAMQVDGCWGAQPFPVFSVMEIDQMSQISLRDVRQNANDNRREGFQDVHVGLSLPQCSPRIWSILNNSSYPERPNVLCPEFDPRRGCKEVLQSPQANNQIPRLRPKTKSSLFVHYRNETRQLTSGLLQQRVVFMVLSWMVIGISSQGFSQL